MRDELFSVLKETHPWLEDDAEADALIEFILKPERKTIETATHKNLVNTIKWLRDLIQKE